MSDVVDIGAFRERPKPVAPPETCSYDRPPPTDRDMILVLNKAIGDLARLVRSMGVEIASLRREVEDLKRR